MLINKNRFGSFQKLLQSYMAYELILCQCKYVVSAWRATVNWGGLVRRHPCILFWVMTPCCIPVFKKNMLSVLRPEICEAIWCYSPECSKNKMIWTQLWPFGFCKSEISILAEQMSASQECPCSMVLVFIVNSKQLARASVPSLPMETFSIQAPNRKRILDSCLPKGKESTAKGNSRGRMCWRGQKKCLKEVHQVPELRGSSRHQNLWTTECLLGMKWASWVPS